MATLYFLPSDDAGKADALDHFAAKLPSYAAQFGISDAEVAQVQADAAAFRHELQAVQLASAYSQHRTNHKNLVRDGGADNIEPPPPLALPPAPPPVPAGVIPRFKAVAQRIKKHPKYTPAIGKDLGIVGSEKVVDPGTWKPILGSGLQAGHPAIAWTKGDADALEIHVDRGDGQGFRFLAIDIKPDYLDNAPLPPPGTGAAWKYKAVYLLDDQQVGQWSDVLTVTVGG